MKRRRGLEWGLPKLVGERYTILSVLGRRMIDEFVLYVLSINQWVRL